MGDIGKEMSKESNRLFFNRFSELKKLVIIYVLVLAWPLQKGADYANLLILVFSDITKTEVNRILYKYTRVFKPNLNNNKVPAWTAIPNSIESEFPKNKFENKEFIDSYSELIDQLLNKTLNGTKTTNEDNKKSEIIKVQHYLDVDIFKHIELRDWQQKVYDSWLKNNNKGFVIASRRTGKTFLAQYIAKDHALNIGPVIVLVNTFYEIEKWKVEINNFNKELMFNKKILFSSNVNDLLHENTILVNTFSNLSRVKFNNKKILLIVEHLETLSKEFGELLNQEYKYRLAFANSKPEVKFIEKNNKSPYFGIKLIDYSFTESWFDELIQKFSLNFVPCKMEEFDDISISNLLYEIKRYYPEIHKTQWLDLYETRNYFKKTGTDVFLIDELIELLQIIKSKTDYIESKFSILEKLNRIVIFCENSYAIKKIHKSLDLVGINHIIYSNDPELYKLSQSPNSWRDEKVLLTDYIEYFSNYELGEIDYSIILGCAGNSNHLKSKIESIISDKHCQKELIIDVLYLEGTFEDPHSEKDAYIDFKDYLKIETKQNSSLVKKQELKKIDLKSSKILLYFDLQYTDYSKHLGIVISSLKIERNIFEVIKISTEISELKTLIETKDYSDVYIVIDKSNDLINNLGQLDNYTQEINIETRITENANLSNLFMFVTQTKKYNYKRSSEVK